MRFEHLQLIRSCVEEDGYFSSANRDIRLKSKLGDNSLVVEKLRSAVKLLVSHGYPATFVLLLDECWDMVHSMTEMVQAGTGNSICNMDILAWLVDPKEGSGFAPHRDRQPDDVASSFRSDGTPKYATCWLALSAAHTDNSCLYMIPKEIDPGYYTSDFPSEIVPSSSAAGRNKRTKKSEKKDDQKTVIHSNHDDVSNPLSNALKNKESYQHIRALPLLSGEFVVFTHRVLHWGSKGRKNYTGEPRISLSVAFSDPVFEAPYFIEVPVGRPPLGLRLALACGQMIVYYQRYSFSSGELLIFKKCFDKQSSFFTPFYRHKVLFEYSSAVMEIESLKVQVPSVAGNGEAVSEKQEDEESSVCDDVRSDAFIGGEEEEEEEEDGSNDDEDGDFDNEEIGDDEGVEHSEEDDDDDEEDGGFFLSNEEEKDDPLEHALDAMLDIEVQAHSAATALKAPSARSEIKMSRKRKRVRERGVLSSE